MSAVAGKSQPAGTNDRIARALEETADLLQQQGANPFRVRAYREGARASPTCLAVMGVAYRETLGRIRSVAEIDRDDS